MSRTKAIKALSAQIRKNGFNYTLHTRGRRSCVYAQQYSEKRTFYEVFLIRTKPAGMVFGKWQPEREIFPKNEDFGYTAWAFTKLENAMAKFGELEANTKLQ